ncbi:folate-binding protein YgfZ [Pseudooceanicola lipolyticus]|uniref:Folate-binding protein YgfZ n=1 Tax=Pseudooceanicola lipolyticus TaxID=2029104 RepID=A0A2M8IXC9_9RHOB|nr:folate-binding protein YgfZ [Pseudooceanicola lipolyticus]PJE35186.1 folate-binding protein YgfZ [Pseudooceanicola lipolyticus]
MATRRILRLTGTETDDFLQNLVTNDIGGLQRGLVYAALLTPQGKYIADFFLKRDGDSILLDVAAPLADDLVRRLTMYKLRAKVEIAETGLHLHRGTGPAPADALPDPRHPDMGWRAYRTEPESDDGSNWDAIRVAHCIPESGIELTPDTFVLEAGFEALNGVDFRKGCYVGQEVTARMKHKTELRKGLRRVEIDGPTAPGDEILSDGKAAGTVFTRSGNRAIAYLRLDRAQGEMTAGEATLRLI